MKPAPPVTTSFTAHLPRLSLAARCDFSRTMLLACHSDSKVPASVHQPCMMEWRQRAFIDVAVVDVRDLVFIALRGFELADTVEHRAIVEVNASYGIGRFRLGRLLLNANDSLTLENRHPKPFGIGNLLQKHHGAFLLPLEGLCRFANVAFDNVVAQHHADFLAVDEGLRQAQRVGNAGLPFLISEAELLQAELFAVLQQAQEVACVLASGDNQNVAHSGIDQRLQRVKNHRLVIDRKQVLVGNPRQRIQPRPNSSGQYDALHESPSGPALEAKSR